MSVFICPTITAFDLHEYRAQMEAIKPFARRVHVDLMDGEFAPSKSPSLDSIWMYDDMISDIHLMYKHPMEYIDILIKLKPSLVVIHFEADVDHKSFADKLHENDIKAGLAILQDTPLERTNGVIDNFDHALIFSGNLGYHGGEADLNLLNKVEEVRSQHPEVEISWDGGINDQNIKRLIQSGVSVLNVGGYIQGSEDPQASFEKLIEVISS